jgi:hypothetical protein
LFIDEKKQTLYIKTVRTLWDYSWDGVFRRSILKPSSINAVFAGNSCYVRDNLFIGHIRNLKGNELYNFLLYNDSGQVVKSFDNYEKFKRTGNWFSAWDFAIKPFSVSECIYVKENSNDTLFCLNEQNELIPKFVFNLGKYGIPKHLREDAPPKITDYEGFLSIPNINQEPMLGGNPNHIFFNIERGQAKNSFPQPKGIKRTLRYENKIHEYEYYSLLGIYDIGNKKIRLLDTDPYSRMSGLINDLDGGMSFFPKYFTPENEMVDVWRPYEMKEFLTESYFAAHEIKNPQAHQKLRELLNNLDEEDNPVIVIAKLK